jgi:hypothetical protein
MHIEVALIFVFAFPFLYPSEGPSSNFHKNVLLAFVVVLDAYLIQRNKWSLLVRNKTTWKTLPVMQLLESVDGRSGPATPYDQSLWCPTKTLSMDCFVTVKLMTSSPTFTSKLFKQSCNISLHGNNNQVGY